MAPRFTEQVDAYEAVQPLKLFDVTCVVGSVYAGDSDFTSREIAFLMIARHGADGEFTFPNEDGTINHVHVETERGPGVAHG